MFMKGINFRLVNLSTKNPDETNVKIDVVEKCAGHGGTFGVMKETHDLANKVGRPTARQIKTKNNICSKRRSS